MSILVATDYSSCSRTAVRVAQALARRRGVPLTLIHAVEPPSLDLPGIAAGTTGWEMEMLRAAEVAIGKEASDLREGGLAAEGRASLGSAALVILDEAQRSRPELIVVGTHGRKGPAHFFLGSVAESVIRSAACPVLVTPAADPDLDRWDGTGSLRLALGADGSQATRAAFSWLGRFAKDDGCEVTLVRVYWPPDEAMRYGLHDPWGGPRRDPELLPLLERDLRQDAESLMGHVPPRLRFRAAGREAAEALIEEAVMVGADALVVGVPRQASSGWTALSPGAVLRASPLPVLCVPETGPVLTGRITPVRAVLVATDLSSASIQAIEPAYRLLTAEGGQVELCTIHAVGLSGASGETPVEPPLRPEQRADLESRLRALVPPNAERLGVRTRISVIEGRFVAEAILAAADRFAVDVIALGSRGRSGLRRAVLGSVAEDVARRSSRPVLIVAAPQRGA